MDTEKHGGSLHRFFLTNTDKHGEARKLSTLVLFNEHGWARRNTEALCTDRNKFRICVSFANFHYQNPNEFSFTLRRRIHMRLYTRYLTAKRSNSEAVYIIYHP